MLLRTLEHSETVHVKRVVNQFQPASRPGACGERKPELVG